jgi:hypothetical protein
MLLIKNMTYLQLKLKVYFHQVLALYLKIIKNKK